MKRPLALMFALVVFGTTSLFGQASSESQKLDYFAGTWKLEIHLNAASLSGKTFHETEHNEWMPGRALLLSRQDADDGANAGVTVLAYDPQNKTFRYHQIKSNGDLQDLRGTFENGTWTWMSAGVSNQTSKTRLIIQEVNDTSYTLKLESATEGRDWSTVMEGKASKVLTRGHQDVAFLR